MRAPTCSYSPNEQVFVIPKVLLDSPISPDCGKQPIAVRRQKWQAKKLGEM